MLTLLQHLPQAPVATDAEVLFFIEQHRLMGRGISYLAAHLLAATHWLTRPCCGRATSGWRVWPPI